MDGVRSLIYMDKLNIMNSQLKETASDTKPLLFAGIDVGAEELVLVIRKNTKSLNPQKFAITPPG
jgi:transposase